MKKLIVIYFLAIVLSAQSFEYFKNPYIRSVGIFSIWVILNNNYLKHSAMNLSSHLKIISGHLNKFGGQCKIIVNNHKYENAMINVFYLQSSWQQKIDYLFERHLRSSQAKNIIFYISTPITPVAILVFNRY